MALRKYEPTLSGYDLVPEEDHLRPMIRGERYYERHDGIYDVVVSSGVRETMAWWVTYHELYTSNGCFREIAQEHNVPRIMAMVKLNDTPLALAMVVNSSRHLGTAYVSGRQSLGFLGMFVRPEARGARLSGRAVRWAGQELKYLLSQCEDQPVDPCVQANAHVREWAGENFPLPVELL